jgi:hypothetical protein
MRCGPRSPQQWSAYHAIQRQAISAALLPGQAYDEHDLDESAPGIFRTCCCATAKSSVWCASISLGSRTGLRLVAFAAIFNGKGMVASYCGWPKPPRGSSAERKSSSMAPPTSLAFYLANGYRQGRMGE